MAVQTAAPIADITTAGWTAVPGSPATMFDKLADSDPATLARSPLAPNGTQPLEVKCAPIVDPLTGNLTFKYGLKKSLAGGAQMDAVVKIMEGATERASFPHTDLPDTETIFQQGVARSVFSTFNNLRYRITGTQVA